MGVVLTIHYYEVPYLRSILRHHCTILYDLLVGPLAIHGYIKCPECILLSKISPLIALHAIVVGDPVPDCIRILPNLNGH